MFKETAILLAAGLSRRMGTQNKLVLPVHGVPLVRHVVDAYTSAIDGPVLVVLGHQSKRVAAALAGSSARSVFNPHYADGQFTSVATGLRHAREAEVLLIGLCDQPLLRPQDISALLKAHQTADPEKISIPVRGTSRGNPIVVPHTLRGHLLEDPRNPGCQKFTRAHPEWVQDLTLAADGYFFDIDTPDAYSTYLKTLQETAA